MSTTNATPTLIRGRVVTDYAGRYAKGRGIVLAVHGTFDPTKERTIGGVLRVIDPNNNGTCDVVWPDGEHAHISNQTPQSLFHSLPYGIRDEIASEADIVAAIAAVEVAQESARNAEKQAATAYAAKADGYRRLYKDILVPCTAAPNTSRYALGAKNLKTELSSAFPGVQFSVKSKGYSGGCSIDVSWELGPTTKQVEAISGKYQEGHFNGMEDIYESNHENPFPGIFGGAKYVMENRSFGDAVDTICAALCDAWGLAKPADGKSWWNVHRSDDPGGWNMCTHARMILEADGLPAGAVVTGIEHIDERRDAQGWAAYYRVAYTAPAAVKESLTTEAAAVAEFEHANPNGPTVTFNAEKRGLEIRFPAKPAEAVLSMLKRHGWRWSRFSSCWYQRANSDTLNAAAQVANLTDTQRAALAAKINFEHDRAGIQGMEAACGIA